MAAASNKQLLSVAPMMDWTDVHYRQLARLLSKHTWLWTEMVVDKTAIHTPIPDKHLWFPPEQRPVVCQLGGSDPTLLAQATKIAVAYGYDEINLNCGCPSDRVAGAGSFGASLMLQPQLVAACMAAMGQAAGATEVNVKCRLGVDSVDSYEQLREFVRVVSEGSPVRHFIVHARKCFLKGLNPHQNRTVPPLRHAWVWALKRDFPHLEFSLNGGVQSAAECRAALELAPEGADGARIYGVMIGRAAYNDPWGCLGDADRLVFGAEGNAATSRRQVLKDYAAYGDAIVGRWQLKPDGHRDPSVRAIMKPVLNLFHGEAGSKRWKQAVDEVLKQNPPTVSAVLEATLHHIPDSVLDAPPEVSDVLPEYSIDALPTDGAERAGTDRPVRPHDATFHAKVAWRAGVVNVDAVSGQAAAAAAADGAADEDEACGCAEAFAAAQQHDEQRQQQQQQQGAVVGV